MIDPDKLTIEARPMATQMAQEIAVIANTRAPEERVPYAGLLSSMVLQNIVVTIALETHAPGSLSGSEFLKSVYKDCLDDALRRWNAKDLKAFEYWEKRKGLRPV